MELSDKESEKKIIVLLPSIQYSAPRIHSNFQQIYGSTITIIDFGRFTAKIFFDLT